MTDDELLASVLRKFVMSDNTYADWTPGSLTLDGHIGKRMTEDENAALGRLLGCPKCGHAKDDHHRESWYDEEGIEGMTCAECDDGRSCRWWTWSWSEVLADEAMWEGEQP